MVFILELDLMYLNSSLGQLFFDGSHRAEDSSAEPLSFSVFSTSVSNVQDLSTQDTRERKLMQIN